MITVMAVCVDPDFSAPRKQNFDIFASESAISRPRSGIVSRRVALFPFMSPSDHGQPSGHATKQPDQATKQPKQPKQPRNVSKQQSNQVTKHPSNQVAKQPAAKQSSSQATKHIQAIKQPAHPLLRAQNGRF
jgi:uncharacterized membrane protein